MSAQWSVARRTRTGGATHLCELGDDAVPQAGLGAAPWPVIAGLAREAALLCCACELVEAVCVGRLDGCALLVDVCEGGEVGCGCVEPFLEGGEEGAGGGGEEGGEPGVVWECVWHGGGKRIVGN